MILPNELEEGISHDNVLAPRDPQGGHEVVRIPGLHVPDGQVLEPRPAKSICINAGQETLDRAVPDGHPVDGFGPEAVSGELTRDHVSAEVQGDVRGADPYAEVVAVSRGTLQVVDENRVCPDDLAAFSDRGWGFEGPRDPEP